MVPTHSNKIGLILRDMGVLTMVDVIRILKEQKRTHKQFGAIAVSWDLATSEQVSEAWARQLSKEKRHVDLDTFQADHGAVRHLSAEQAQRLRALPLRCWGPHMIVAIVSLSLDGRVLEEIAEATGHRYVYPCFCSPEQLARGLAKYYPQEIVVSNKS